MADLPTPARPRVSVVVLAFRHARLLHRGLAALARHHTRIDFETIVVLNGASDHVCEVVDRWVRGAVVVRSSVNLGFAGGCNRGVRASRGEFVVLLNDDTEVEDGWLDALVDTVDGHPEAGAVGSRVRDPWGTLQEAGGILWRDGSIWHVGRLVAHTTPRYRYLRRVDYCSGCSLLVRRSTWDAVGGLDEGYFPGYYEDLDLCLKISGLGQTILYQPRSRLLHHGGGDEGSLDHRAKEFVARRSKQRFLSLWSSDLGRYPEPPEATPPAPEAMPTVERATALARHLPLRALVVAERADREVVHAVEEMAAAGRGYAVTLAVPTGGRLPDGVADRLGDAGVEVVGHLPPALAGTLAFDVVVIEGRALWDEWSDPVRRAQPHVPLVFWATTEDDARRPPVDEVEQIVCPSPRLAAIGRGAVPVAVVEPRRPPRRGPAIGFGARRHIVAGGPSDWLTAEVMPQVRAGAPDARLHTVDDDAGGPSPRAVAAITLRAAVAALADGVPMVTTPAVAADLAPDLAAVALVANDADAFAAHLVRLLTDRRAWERQRRAIADLPPPDPSTAGRWVDVLDAARHHRLDRRAAG